MATRKNKSEQDNQEALPTSDAPIKNKQAEKKTTKKLAVDPLEKKETAPKKAGKKITTTEPSAEIAKPKLPKVKKVTVAKVEKSVPAVRSKAAPKKPTLNNNEKDLSSDTSAATIAVAPVEKATEPIEETLAKRVKSSSSTSLKITFQLKYTTQFGQSLYIMGDNDVFGGNEVVTALPMQYLNNEFWYAVVDFPDATSMHQPITYKYYVKNEDGTISMEWGDDKKIIPSSFQASEVTIIDSWNYAGYYENSFYTEPFKQVLLKENFTAFATEQPSIFTHTFKVKAPLLPKGHTVCLSGNAAALNRWELDSALLMSRSEGDDWFTINVDLSEASFPVVYKYGIYNIEDRKLTELETGNNRFVYDAAATKKLTILADGFIRVANNTFKGAGVSIPVFSLRSNSGLGVGEFSDLKKLVDWSKSVGLKVIQILPVNDTTATHTSADSYPYAAISAFALHPIYLNLPEIIGESNPVLLSEAEKIGTELNMSDVVDYDAVMKAKLDFIKQIFPLQKQEIFTTEDFNTFFSTNAHWLVPYAAFRYLTDENGTADFTKWESNNTFDVFEINALATPVLAAKEEISIHYFIQYNLHLQLKSATEYAHANGVIVKGDIPIGIFRNSCDAWQQPQLYNMDMQAGAPPDDFAVAGQNWGFPTYNWQRMSEDGFGWWKQRFAQMSYYFDAFRIDHILGFFRIWSIPMNAVEGIMGYFVPSIPVHINEFNEKGIWFDQYRYTKPFINDAVLYEVFGSDAEEVKTKYLSKKIFDNYDLLPGFETQRSVEEYFASQDESELNKKIKQGLFTLISNMILFEVAGSQGQQYHFRIAAENTSSFRSLEEGTKHKLKDLYVNYFYRRQDDFWMKEALQKLPELKRSTNMLICGEDLGMVPDCVPGVMKQLGILSLEIQRMPKDPSREFFHPNDAPYLSVVTPSTHDMSTIRGWWEEDRSKTQRFFNHELTQHGDAPYFCEAWINRAIILQHLYSPAMWSIFQMQDILGMSKELRRDNPAEERINIPSNPKHYWRYRMHVSIEDLILEEKFNNELAAYVTSSGR